MIKAVVLDIDGVILGTKVGINFPEPHPEIIEALKTLQTKGIPVALCSAKPTSGLYKIIDDAELEGLHISNNGAVIYNAQDKTCRIHKIPAAVIEKAMKVAIERNIYMEVFSESEYFTQFDMLCGITDILIDIRRSAPILVDNFIENLKGEDILRFSLIVSEENKSNVEAIAKEFENDLSMHWSTSPMLPEWIGVFTLKGISKKSGVQEIAKYLNIPLDNILAVGDGINDWNFMEVCGYAASMGNGHQELKDLVSTKCDRGFIGPDVDENGLIEIFKHFNVL